MFRAAVWQGSSLCGLYNLSVRSAQAPEFSLRRPLPSALAGIRAVLFSPRSFYLNFSAEGPLREPAVFVLLIGAVTGALTAVVAIASGLLFGEVSAGGFGVTVLEALLFALLSPLAVGVVAGIYLLSIRTFIGKMSSFREVYRMAAYAFGTLILSPSLSWAPSPSPTPFPTDQSDKRSRLAFQVALSDGSQEPEVDLGLV
jgi:hypothetical protein